MKTKFLGSKTAGRIATPSELGERELFINLTDKKLYTSDGTTVMNLSGSDIRGTEYSALFTYGAGDIVSSIGKVYVSNSAGNIGNALSDATKWHAVNHVEQGGVSWHANTSYDIGDSVVDPNTGIMYVCTVAGTSGVVFRATGQGTLIFTDAFAQSNVDPGTF